SMNSTPAARHASISDGRMGREALLTSVSPRQNFWKPPPVPDTPTVTRASVCVFWNSSATASLIGNTVLEPSTRIVGAAASATTPAEPAALPQAVIEPPSTRLAATRAHTDMPIPYTGQISQRCPTRKIRVNGPTGRLDAQLGHIVPVRTL